ncbi:TetR/AcrR family transcriptional regulator [Paraglaciecola arctica]|uniref:TetR/AcrR family transcriptional regulator n=1 Tax=Paraglaciecola arctica TaxID=1128911 RepID=UPI001C0703F5|nr:TetR/AcrR family transcriptional regulator [Paraglaciecola arctica]
MKTLRPQRGIAARTENKIKRRQNILDQARTMIATDGFQAFTLVELANKAQVTVPTIHNLIGNKADICRQLVEDMVTRTEHLLEQQEFGDPISTVEAFTNNLMALYADDETFYKAAFFIGEQEKLFEHELPSGIFHNALQLALQVCIDAKEKGYLLGNIDSLLLAEKLFANQRLARQDWMNGYIDLSEYKHQVLTGMFITFAADASSGFHQELIQKITSLTATSQ